MRARRVGRGWRALRSTQRALRIEINAQRNRATRSVYEGLQHPDPQKRNSTRGLQRNAGEGIDYVYNPTHHVASSFATRNVDCNVAAFSCCKMPKNPLFSMQRENYLRVASYPQPAPRSATFGPDLALQAALHLVTDETKINRKYPIATPDCMCQIVILNNGETR